MKRSIGMALAGAVLGAVALQAAPYVELPNGTRVDGTDIRVTSRGEVVLNTAAGQRTFTKGQYVRAVADKPADFDKARQLAAAKNYGEAETLLKTIIQKNIGLEWDVMGRVVLAREVYGAKGDHVAAVTTFEELLRTAPERKADSSLMWAYRDALLNAKQFDKLKPQLDEVVAGGSRSDAAKAQILRGDIKMASNQVEPAVLDYLRTVVLFESEKEWLPEALFKAGAALEKLRDPRAKAMQDRLKAEFGESPWAAKLGK